MTEFCLNCGASNAVKEGNFTYSEDEEKKYSTHTIRLFYCLECGVADTQRDSIVGQAEE